ncbi:UPF0481 protein At3g47200-like [Rhododendron vialii]|uniref:UPF0481 protein At3g47200-like n=1 Tax=Rhododendron vialii TaxID=182163 RepID=UPI00265EC6DC|nr:UPF0481 protein At3g47200-like [Rhododendron vialii]
MIQRGNDDKQAPKIPTKTIGEKFNDGTEKIKSLYSIARIYKVPEDLRKLNECAYVPRLIAIGPLHRKGEHLQKPMQDVKMDYANRLFLRLAEGIADSKIRDEKKDKLIQECVEEMKKCTVKAKKYYAEDIELNDDEMVEMMLVDGCFILELLYEMVHKDSSSIRQPINGGKQPRADPICDSILTANIVRHDLMLLENQIPFFVLEHLFQLTVAKIPVDPTMVAKIPVDPTTGCPPKLSLEVYVRSYFSQFLSLEGGVGGQSSDHRILSVCDSTKETKQGKTESGKANDYHHILHLIHRCYIPGGEVEETGQNSKKHCELMLSASDLHYAGVKFVPTTDLHKVKFINKGIGCWQCRTLAFQIPTIYISKTTESFLRNVIALEQCSPRVPRYFTSYAKLMDMFINSAQDVQVLKNDRVIYNYLSTDEDVRDLFNKLCKEVVLEDFHFNEDCREAYKFNMRWRTRAVRYVTRLFVANPWPALAFCIGIAAFAITVYQFGYAIRARYRR